jgi:pantoate--beta-alanine ligase
VTQVDVGSIGDVLEGQHRPGHFRGVATVVLKLFNMVQPDIAYFGQKDAQQVRVIQQLVADLDLPIMLRIGPTIREADGLALSSRNRYLSPEERVSARCLYVALDRAKMLRGQGATSVASVEAAMRSVVDGTPRTKLDYVALVNPETFQPVASLVGPVLALIAVRIGSTRLIDNLRLDA